MKAARTRKLILEKAAPLFNKKGYEGTSLADLSHITGLTKGALYGNFPDKEALACEAFTYSVKMVKDLVRKELSGLTSYKTKLAALLDFYARYVLDPPIAGGCPLLNTAIEADDHRLSMRGVVAHELIETIGFIADLLNKGIRAGEFKKDFNPRELAYTFFCAIEGAIMFSRVERSSEPMDIIIKHCKIKLDQISNPLCKNG
jgi:AcrR family transcriptional regulator